MHESPTKIRTFISGNTERLASWITHTPKMPVLNTLENFIADNTAIKMGLLVYITKRGRPQLLKLIAPNLTRTNKTWFQFLHITKPLKIESQIYHAYRDIFNFIDQNEQLITLNEKIQNNPPCNSK